MTDELVYFSVLDLRLNCSTWHKGVWNLGAAGGEVFVSVMGWEPWRLCRCHRKETSEVLLVS